MLGRVPAGRAIRFTSLLRSCWGA